MKRLLLSIIFVMILFVSFSQTAFAAEQETAINSEIGYHILVDRFNNGDSSRDEQVDLEDPFAYHGGDLQGVTDQLDHLQDFGYTTLVLSPIMENAPNGYHGYWIEDFYQVDDQFGTMEDLQELVDEAHSRDMKVVLEFVTNYVSETHPITKDPDRNDWLKENDGPESLQWMNSTVMLDQTNSDVQNFIKDVADYWIDETNIDGFKLHAADQANQEFLDELTADIHENNPDFYLLGDILDGESYTGDLTEDTAIQAADSNELYTPMTEVFAEAGTPLTQIHETLQNNDMQGGLNYLDNPYTERFTNKLLENGRKPLTGWQLALTYLYTAPGAPMIYQGSEIPMGGGSFPENQQLVNWNSGDEELEEFTNRMAALRAEFPVLQHGDYALVDSSGAMSLFKRSYDGNAMYIAINNDTQSQVTQVDDISADKQMRGLLEDDIVRDNGNGQFTIGLPRESAEVYIVEDNTGLNWFVIAPIAAIFIVFVAGIIYLTRKQKKREANA
ncbi:alpha-amylase family glycosyl hydrolase [Lentibacillus sp. CBA3610]|uniref:alpha-amylase family glycosyl hydrolase n=1 Tax=Lentibacillus sp. CBA3610 TaxID=2518176 RepID=UPI001594F777|nr:alpha-amylase family glycosyl hydrolase [Lentibacillus sp. CBA3610]QKY68562.1 alpha-amlyase [Lentibacillus sp. CBA3610]